MRLKKYAWGRNFMGLIIAGLIIVGIIIVAGTGIFFGGGMIKDIINDPSAQAWLNSPAREMKVWHVLLLYLLYFIFK